MNFENVMIKSESIDVDEDNNIVEDTVDSKIKESANDKLSKCGICGHCTTSNILLRLHMKMHFMKRIHQCGVCRKTFSFVTELNAHMVNHQNIDGNINDSVNDYSYLAPHSNGDTTTQLSGCVQKDMATKKFKNNPNLPMNTEEKHILLQYVEEMELNTKYVEMESLKSYLRKSWIKMSELFAKKEYDRSPEKLARTYIHMKNQAKLHIERFYKHKKLPRPRHMDYLFVKLCPADFKAIGLDVMEIMEDFRIFENGNHPPIKSEITSEITLQTSEDEMNSEDAPDLILPEDIQTDNLDPESPLSRKMTHPEISETPHKIQRLDSDEPFSKDINELKIKFLIAEEQRRKQLYSNEIAQKDELFQLELRHKKEIHEKEMEIKKLELILLKQRLQQNHL
ncbi:unnamed protein product [Phaedon cochleariae]|uniref:C2H2-type domain-containing protein n=1 Tax=Phaedon cochleariae TaxID=80249 RepID=A0A9N9SAU8_PHACE|nr:unnamed protein product [Phaedon cochleariae]